jgi:FMN-dependent NADH-azoreductase
MKKLLFITCSPRGEQSNSYQLAEYFTHNLINKSNGEWCIDLLNLWNLSLPPIDLNVSNAKYAIMSGKALSLKEQSSWEAIKYHCDRFNTADAIVIALPMWNFGIPYILKHYIDVITQPEICFSWSPAKGYVPLVESKRCVLVSSSAADFSLGSGNEQNEFAVSYLNKWLKVYFGHQVEHLDFSPTAMTGVDVEDVKKIAFEQANVLISTFHSSS